MTVVGKLEVGFYPLAAEARKADEIEIRPSSLQPRTNDVSDRVLRREEEDTTWLSCELAERQFGGKVDCQKRLADAGIPSKNGECSSGQLAVPNPFDSLRWNLGSRYDLELTGRVGRGVSCLARCSGRLGDRSVTDLRSTNRYLLVGRRRFGAIEESRGDPRQPRSFLSSDECLGAGFPIWIAARPLTGRGGIPKELRESAPSHSSMANREPPASVSR